MNENEQVNGIHQTNGNDQININPYIQNEMGRLNYELLICKAQLDHALKSKGELIQKVQELESKLIESKENKKAEPKK